MERIPNELLLAFFGDFSYNELRAIIATCSRWRALRERCRGFWADIQTPRSGHIVTFDGARRTAAAEETACARIACTNGRKFTLSLRGVCPRILAAVAEHVQHIERLKVEFSRAGEFGALSEAIRGAQAAELVSVSLRCSRYALGGSLPRDLFASTACPVLTTVCMIDARLPATGSFQSFSGVSNVRYWPRGDFLGPGPPDLFAYFPSMRFLSLRGYVADMEEHLSLGGVTVLRSVDWSRIELLELLDSCWELACHEGWPLHSVPHIVCADSVCEELPFVDVDRLDRAHIIFEHHAAGIGACVRVGNEDWSYSRTCAVSAHELSPDEPDEPRDGIRGAYYNFSIPGSLETSIVSGTVPAAGWHLCAPPLRHLANLRSLRILLGADNSLESLGSHRRLPCAQLDTLILRAARDTIRIGHDNVARFANAALDSVAFPLRLQLENVELTGQPSSEFAACFSDVEVVNANSWSYLSLKQGDPWNEV